MLPEHYRLFCTILCGRFVQPEGEEEYEAFRITKENNYRTHAEAFKAMSKLGQAEKEKYLKSVEILHEGIASTLLSFPPRLMLTLRYSKLISVFLKCMSFVKVFWLGLHTHSGVENSQ